MPLGKLATKIREAKTSEVEPQVSEGISERGRSPLSADDTALAVVDIVEPSEVEVPKPQAPLRGTKQAQRCSTLHHRGRKKKRRADEGITSRGGVVSI